MSVLEGITGPRDLDGLSKEQLVELADEIRRFLVEEVSKTGGHLGPNLGVVELTMAIHRVFDSPRDAIVFDTGHQSYVHKLLTGRHDFSRLRMKGGLAGLPAALRVGARHRRELARIELAQLGRRHLAGVRDDRARPTGTSSRSSATARSPAG